MPRSPRPGRARSAGCPCVCPSMQMAQLPASPCPRGGASPPPPASWRVAGAVLRSTCPSSLSNCEASSELLSLSEPRVSYQKKGGKSQYYP